MTLRCILCGGCGIEHLTKLSSRTLREAYLEHLGVSIDLGSHDHIDYVRCSRCDLRFFTPIVTGDAGFYRQLQKIDWYYREEKAEFDIATRHISPQDSVLEIGAGKGAFRRWIPQSTYSGLETSPDAIEIAKSEGIDLFQQSIEAYSEANPRRHDVVCAFQVLEHVSDPRSFMQSAAKCLRSKGRLIVAVPSEDSFANIDYWDVLNMPPHHITRWADACLRGLADILGLRLLAIEHERLPDRDVRWCARLISEYAVAKRRGHEPALLDPYMQQWMVRKTAKLFSSYMRRALQHSNLRPIGHSVVAIYALD